MSSESRRCRGLRRIAQRQTLPILEKIYRYGHFGKMVQDEDDSRQMSNLFDCLTTDMCLYYVVFLDVEHQLQLPTATLFVFIDRESAKEF